VAAPLPAGVLGCAGVARMAGGWEGSSGAALELPQAGAVRVWAVGQGMLRLQGWSTSMNLLPYVFMRVVENGDPSL